MTASGAIVFLPWVTTSAKVSLQGFDFVPFKMSEINEFVADEQTASCISSMLLDYVDLKKETIKSCTFITTPNSNTPFYVDNEKLSDARSAARTFALVNLAEQRFFEGHLAPHINASVFDPIIQHLEPPDTRIALSIPWRDGGLTIGGPGMRFGKVGFVEPFQAYRTQCPNICSRFVKGLEEVRRTYPEVWAAIEGAAPIWLLANREDATLSTEACVTLSAIAFERLFDSEGNANTFSEKFVSSWMKYSTITMACARKAEVDKSKFGAEQKSWSICRKWAKELYESRSSFVHRGSKPTLSENWKIHQHLVLAAFSFPLTIKLILRNHDCYQLSETDHAWCTAFELLLDRWDPLADNPMNENESWDDQDAPYTRPSWSSIVSTSALLLDF